MARIQIASGGGVGAAATLARLGDGAASAELTDMRAEADMLRGQCGDLLAAAPGKTPLSATPRRVRALCALDGGATGAGEQEVTAGLTDHPGDAPLQPAAGPLAHVAGRRMPVGCGKC